MGQGLNFDGSNDTLDLGSSYTGFNGAEGTVTMWIKWDSFVAFKAMFAFRNTANTYIFDIYRLSATQVDFQRYVPGFNKVVTVTTAPNLNQWYHFAFRWSEAADELRMFVDGVSVGSVGSIGSWAGTATNVHKIGSFSGGCCTHTGHLDDVRVYPSSRAKLTTWQATARCRRPRCSSSISSVPPNPANLQPLKALGGRHLAVQPPSAYRQVE